MKAAGQTIAQVESDIRTRLADGYVVNPQVAIGVAQFKSQRVFVVGEVRTPGVVPLSGTLTLIEALTRVGSLTEFAGGELVVIRPPEGKQVDGPVLSGDPGAREVLRLDIQPLQAKGPTSNIQLEDGDTVVIPRAEVIYVTGQVNAPGTYNYERDMTLLRAISKASGVNEMGSDKRLKILRIVDGKRIELKASLGDKVQPGDTVDSRHPVVLMSNDRKRHPETRSDSSPSPTPVTAGVWEHLRTFVRHRWWALAGFVLLAVPMAAVTLTTTPVFEATTRVLVGEDPQRIGLDAGAPRAPQPWSTR